MDTTKKIGKWKASRILLSRSWEVLKKQKEIALLPLWSLITSLVAIIVIGFSIGYINYGSDFIAVISENNGSESDLAFYIGGVIIAITLQIISTYFNAAIIQSADTQLRGEKISNKKSLLLVRKKSTKILVWATINATVGIILKQISERSKLLGKIVSMLVGAAWSISTFFILPIIVLEEVGPKAAAKKSLALIKKTWGEAFITNAGVGLAMIGLIFIGFIPMVLALISGIPGLMISAVIFSIVWVILAGLIISTLNIIIKVILYRYANNMDLPQEIDTKELDVIFTK